MIERMTQVSPKDYRVIEDTLSTLACARSLTVLMLFRASQFEDIYNLEFNPADYNSLDDARVAFAATELIKKNRFLHVANIDKAEVALSKFWDCEDSCRATNERLLRSNSDYEHLLWVMSRKIANILGELNYEEVVVSSGWGPGVTLTLKSGANTLFEKFRHHGEATPTFLPVAQKLCELISPLWKIRPACFEGNRVITVPKNAKTDRVIAVEPSLNLFFQKGVGAVIRQRLSRWGIDLKNQGRNQALSRAGSYDGSLATVDFSSASDMISYVLVMQLLPFHWFQLLDLLRSPRGLVGSQLIEYNKFSSMGNGFTFELESLIFYVAALAVADEMGVDASSISVYGDDVVIPTSLYQRYTELCKHLGFVVNRKKSYSSTYFRESCGGYFWNGVSIKPPRVLESLTAPFGDVKFHNRLYEFDCQEEFLPRFSGVRTLIQQSSTVKCRVPRSYGDVGFTVPARELIARGRYRFQCLQNVPLVSKSDDPSVLLAHLYLINGGCAASPDSDGLTVRFGHGVIRDGLSSIGNDCPVPRRGKTRIRAVNLPIGVVDLDAKH